MKKYLTGLRPVIIIVLLLGIFFRFANLNEKVYWIDEVHTSLRVSGYTETEVIEEIPSNQVMGIADLQKFQHLSPETSLWQTTQALASAEHSPLYYFLTRFGMQWFGSSPTVTRSLAAAISLLALPCIYWLSLELFASPLVGWISVALLAVSPFHLLYAQEAREYSLLSVTILLSSATLLWAMRRQTRAIWGIYAITVALGLYAHPPAGLVILGHGIYVFFSENWRLSRTLIAYLLSAFAGLIAFAPWIAVFIFNGVGVGTWVTQDISIQTLLQRWVINLSATFFDLQIGYSEQLFNIKTGEEIQLTYKQPVIYLMIPVLGLIGYSFYFLYRQASERVWWFILTLIGVTALALAVPDLITGGQRSTIARYAIACYIGVELTVAYCLASGISIRQQKFWQLATTTLISFEVACCIIITEADTWWNKYSSYYNPQVAEIINQADQPLVISNTERITRSTSLSYLLKPQAGFMLLKESEQPKIPDNFSEIFLFRPFEQLRQAIEKHPNYYIQPAQEKGKLWRITIKN